MIRCHWWQQLKIWMKYKRFWAARHFNNFCRSKTWLPFSLIVICILTEEWRHDVFIEFQSAQNAGWKPPDCNPISERCTAVLRKRKDPLVTHKRRKRASVSATTQPTSTEQIKRYLELSFLSFVRTERSGVWLSILTHILSAMMRSVCNCPGIVAFLSSFCFFTLPVNLIDFNLYSTQTS